MALKSKYSLQDMKDAGFTARQLFQAGFPVWQLCSVGFNSRQLREAGCTIEELMAAGYTAVQLYAAGAPIPQLRIAGYSAADLRECRQLQRARLDSIAESKSLEELFQLGYSPVQLLNAGLLQRT